MCSGAVCSVVQCVVVQCVVVFHMLAPAINGEKTDRYQHKTAKLLTNTNAKSRLRRWCNDVVLSSSKMTAFSRHVHFLSSITAQLSRALCVPAMLMLQI